MKWRHGLWVALWVACGGCEQKVSFPRPETGNALSTHANGSADIRTAWVGPDTVTVAPGVHVLGRLFPSAAFAIETNDGVILIDSGVDESGRLVRSGFAEVGLQIKDLRYILLTHAHYDHVFGANKLRSISGAIVCAGRDDCQPLRAADQEAMFSVFPRVEYSGDPIHVDRELDDGDVIEIGDVMIEVLSTPGHTPGSVCYLLHKDNQRILFSGDVIASLNLGPATYPVHLGPHYRGDAEQYLQTIRRLLAMDPPDLLLTGHPRQQQSVYSVKLMPGQWQHLLRPAETELEQVVAQHRADGRDFLADHPKQIESGLWYLGVLDQIGVYVLEIDEQWVVINAPGGEQFPAFLSARQKLLDLPAKQPAFVLLTSADQPSWSGLRSLDPRTRLVAAEPVWASLTRDGIDLIRANSTELGIETIALGGTNAYSVAVGGKQVLLTPKVPRNLSLFWKDRLTGATQSGAIEPQTSQLRTELGASATAAIAYRDALEQLAKLQPDIWLPAMPLVGQNANLYDDQWRRIIDDNRRQMQP